MNEQPIPGSIVLLDLTQQHDHSKDIVLSPTPSNDVNDPLRWTAARKRRHIIMLMLYTTTIGISTASLYSVLGQIESNTGIPLSTLNAGTGYMFLLLGWGGLITQPLALAYGKRPLYLISQIGSVGVVIWMAFIKKDSEWLANKVVQGLTAAPIEMLVEVSIADIFYAHERGWYMGLYAFMLFGSNYIGPLIAGWMAQTINYKWVFYFCAIQQGVGLLISVFFLEETNYTRGSNELGDNHQELIPSSGSALQDDLETTGAEEQAMKGVTPRHTVEPVSVELQGVPHSLARQMRLFRETWATPSQVFWMMIRPLQLLAFPCVFWSGFVYGASLVWYNVLNATASLILTGDTYHFSSGLVGTTYLGPLIGVFLSAMWSGYFGDRFSLWITRRRGGIREPEDRLWLMGITVIMCPAALILWGVGAADGIHWFGLVVGFAMSAFSTAVGAALTINYAIDCYKDQSASVMATVIIVRNSLSFAVGYGITPWLTLGLKDTFLIAAFVGMAINATFLIVIKFGKGWRKSSRKTYWKYVADNPVPMGH